MVREREKEGNSKRWKVISKNVKMCPMPKPLSNKFKLLPVPTQQQYALRMKHRRRVTRYSSYGIAFAFFTSINSSFKLLVNEHKNSFLSIPCLEYYILTLRKPNCRPKKMSPQTLSQQQWLNLEVKSYPSSKTEAIQVTATRLLKKQHSIKSMHQKIRIQWVFRRSRRVTRRNFELEENFGLARPNFCRLRSRF